MARPIKDGVDYFPLDVNLDMKFRLLEAKYGIVGFAVIIKLYQRIYGDCGYYCKWNDDIALIMAAENSCTARPLTVEDVQNIVTEAVARGIFDKGMYEKYSVLTSKGIQERYLEMTKRRSKVDVESKYLLISIPENIVNVNINGVNVNTNSKNVCNNTQSKVKESKVNKSKVKETIEAPPVVVPQNIIDAFQNNIAPLTPIITQAIADWLGDVDADVIEWAIREAVSHNKRNWRYIEAILNNHFNAGRTSMAAINEAQRNFRKPEANIYNDNDIDYDELEKIMRGNM